MFQFRATFIIFLLMVAALQIPAFAKDSSNSQMSTFDFFAAPKALAGGGSYKAGGIDEGRLGVLLYGGKAGFKIGPLLIGGEYLEGNTSAESSKETVSDANRFKFPMPDHEKIRMAGLAVGFTIKRLSVWLNLYPYASMEKSAIVAGNKFTHTYHGSGSSIEANVRVWDMIHIGGFYQKHSFTKYTSDYAAGLADKADLNPGLNTAVYGVSLSYLIPFSKIHDMIK